MPAEASTDATPGSATSALTVPPQRADEIFLEGPRSRFEEFFTLLRVMRDFLRGFRTLHFVAPCVTVFGSARIKPDDPHYQLAQRNGRGHCAARIHRDDRRRSRDHGSGQPRRERNLAAARSDAISSCHSSKYPTRISIAVSGCIIFSSVKRC